VQFGNAPCSWGINYPTGNVVTWQQYLDEVAAAGCGRLTGYFEESGLVDWAVGALLVEEAGGVVTDWWGRGPEFYELTGCVANRATHAYLLEKLRDAPRKHPKEL